MTKVMAKRVVRQLMNAGVMAFDFSGGGEPLLMPGVRDVIADIRQAKCHFGIITNGTAMTGQMTEWLVYCGTYVRFSLEASDRETYAKYKGKDQWDRVIRNIQLVVKAKKQAKSQLEIGVKFAVGKSLWGLRHYERGIRLGRELGVDNVQFKALRHEPEELPEKMKCDEVVKLAKAVRAWGPGKDFVRSWIVPYKAKDIPQCWLNPLHVVVDAHANVYLCCYYYYRPETHKIGNLAENEFKDIWGSDRHRKAIKNINIGECAKVDCKFFNHHQVVARQMGNGKEWFL